MMTACIIVYTRDAIKLVVKGIALEGEEVDGKKGGEGPHVEMWPGALSNLKTALCAWIIVCLDYDS